jgi:hypothetical protein
VMSAIAFWTIALLSYGYWPMLPDVVMSAVACLFIFNLDHGCDF